MTRVNRPGLHYNGRPQHRRRLPQALQRGAHARHNRLRHPQSTSCWATPAIFVARDRKLAESYEQRKQLRHTRHEQREARAYSSRPAIDFGAVRASITQVLAHRGFTLRSDHGQQRGACP
jgi:hypothetical protein